MFTLIRKKFTRGIRGKKIAKINLQEMNPAPIMAPSREPPRGCTDVLAETGEYPKFEYEPFNAAIRVN